MATKANDFTIRWGVRLAAVLAVGLGSYGCGYYHYSTGATEVRVRPVVVPTPRGISDNAPRLVH